MRANLSKQLGLIVIFTSFRPIYHATIAHNFRNNLIAKPFISLSVSVLKVLN